MKRQLTTTLAACALLLGLGTASASARPLIGLQGLGSNPSASIAAAKTAGAQVIRLGASWAALQPDGPGPVDAGALAGLDATMRAAKANGLRVVLHTTGTPCWASAAPADVRGTCTGAARTSPEVLRYHPADPATAVPIQAFLAQRYAGQLAAYQLWNEPDQVNELYWAGPNKVATYVAFAKGAYPAIKAVAPNVPVLAGSFVGVNGEWLKALYAAGMKGSYDALSVQFYPTTLEALRTTRAVQRANGDTKPLWLTEWGFNACKGRETAGQPNDQPCVTQTAQARGIADVLGAIRSRSWIAAAILFETQDAPGGYQLGLISANGKRKPAYKVFGRYARGARTKPKRPTIRATFRRGRLTLSGTATVTESLTLSLRKAGTRTQKVAGIRADANNRWSLRLPTAFGGARGYSFQVRGAWTGASKTLRR